MSIPFIVWLCNVSWKLIKKINDKSILPTAIFFTLLVNFLFDFTYFDPTMLWLWFIALGLAQNEIKSSALPKKTIDSR